MKAKPIEIEATLEFDPGSLERVLERLLSLPAGLRPTHHSLGENERGKPITDPERFVESAKEETPGPYLTGFRCKYDISVAVRKPIVCRGYLDLEPYLVEQFLTHMAALRPVFGFACVREELEQRNRVTIQQGVNTIESWVGRDTQKYVPGFYWLTLLPDALAKRHGVPLSEIEKIALEHIELEGSQHLLRFYEHPEDWEATSAVAELCASLPGVFDVEKVKPQLPAAKNFLELHTILRSWN